MSGGKPPAHFLGLVLRSLRSLRIEPRRGSSKLCNGFRCGASRFSASPGVCSVVSLCAHRLAHCSCDGGP
jgi:hypothetical protein